jgi:hypothetical protein
MYECDSKHGPPEQWPELSVQRGFILMLRREERRDKGCEAVGESHQFEREFRSGIAICDADKKVIGGLDMLSDKRARFATPGYSSTGRTVCIHCGRTK